AVRLQRRGDLGADEPAADDEDARALRGGLTQPPVVVERPEVDRVRVVESPWLAAGGEQQPLVLVLLALVVRGPVRVQVERDDAPAERQFDAERLGAAPDRALVLALPERLRQRWAAIGRMTLGADEPDR